MNNDLKSRPPQSTDCEALRELLPAYAFGASDPDEIATVERLLPHCREAAAELEEYRALSIGYSSSVPQIEPPASLLANLLMAAQPTAVRATAAQTPKIRQTRFPAEWVTVAAAGLALLIALNLWGLAQVANLSNTVEGQSELLADFASENILTFNLIAPAGVANNARATVYCNPDRSGAVIRAENFPPADGYQVWLWRNGERDKGGTLNVDTTGAGTSVFRAPHVMGAYQYISITPPESEAPTPVVRGSLYLSP